MEHVTEYLDEWTARGTMIGDSLRYSLNQLLNYYRVMITHYLFIQILVKGHGHNN